MTRRESREAVFCMVYEWAYNEEYGAQTVYENAVTQRELTENDFLHDTFFGVTEHLSVLDGLIREKSEGWGFERLSRVALAALRLGIYELLYTDTPYTIVINEAMEIVKKYDDEKTRGFVNGILNAVAESAGKKAGNAAKAADAPESDADTAWEADEAAANGTGE